MEEALQVNKPAICSKKNMLLHQIPDWISEIHISLPEGVHKQWRDAPALFSSRKKFYNMLRAIFNSITC